MPNKSHRKKQRCALCGGELRKTTLTHQEQRGARFYLFHNVPAEVCSACGEVWIGDSTLQEVERLIRRGHPVRKVETPVFDPALAGR